MFLPDAPPFIGPIPLDQIAQGQHETVAKLAGLDLVTTVSTFGGLLLVPELQGNCFRIEALAHLCLAHCQGTAQPNPEFIAEAFERANEGFCGMAEDPAEDVFVTTVHTSNGTYRILPGFRESAGFSLQLLLDVISTMPSAEPFASVRDSVDAMLRLSDELLKRAGPSYDQMPADGLPKSVIPTRVAEALPHLRALLRFTNDDLESLCIARASLAAFVLDQQFSISEDDLQHGHSALERRPIIAADEALYFVLPTAASTSITRFAIEFVLANGYRAPFERLFARELANRLSASALIPDRSISQIPFQRVDSGQISTFAIEVDAGRWVHFVLFVDGLSGFSDSGLAGISRDGEGLARQMHMVIERAVESELSRGSTFRRGLILIILAGLGRRVEFALEHTPLPIEWSIEFISAADFITLGHVRDVGWIELLTILDSKRRLEQHNIDLFNISGLLNLVAWADQSSGHLAPPDCVPISDRPALAWVPQNALRRARQNAQLAYARLRIRDIDEESVLVEKLSSSYLPEDIRAPLFVSLDHLSRDHLRGVYQSPSRSWWFGISAASGSSRAAVVDYWRMLCTWTRRIVPALEAALPNFVRTPLLFDMCFGRLQISRPATGEQVAEAELRTLIDITAQPGDARMSIKFRDRFELAFSHSENIAERLIVEAMATAAYRCAGVTDPEGPQSIVRRICENPHSRHVHAFAEPTFRDYVSHKLRRNPILVGEFANGLARVGLGWKAHGRSGPSEVRGVEECVVFLNATVSALIAEISGAVRRFGRIEFCTAVLLNSEAAALDRERWMRTAKANLALHENEAETISIIAARERDLTACRITSRILLEIGVCECGDTSSRRLGDMDLLQLMATASQVFLLGGWSDAIRWGAVSPHLRITGTGDVQLDQTFYHVVYAPFGQAGAEGRVRDAAESYEKSYEPAEPVASVSSFFAPEFNTALKAEFGVDLDSMRRFLDRIEDKARTKVKAVMGFKRSSLVRELVRSADIPHEIAAAALDHLSLGPRKRWSDTPPGHEHRDLHPWRFRRRLSILRRPFLTVTTGGDPLVLFAPALVREAFVYTAKSFHAGEIPEWQTRSREMRQWLGSAHHTRGHDFASSVASRLRELGWCVDLEVRLTRLVGRSLPRDFGDIDVLAWNAHSRRVLLLECKDLQYRKTLGEVAEQLGDYRGEMRRDGKRDDLLKHLDRVAIIEANRERVSAYLKIIGAARFEPYLIFKNPVPMQFAWKQITSKIGLALFDELDQLF